MYHLPSKDAARQLNISLSRLKRSCRVYRVMRWPHRKLSSLRNLRETISNDRNMRPPDKEVRRGGRTIVNLSSIC